MEITKETLASLSPDSKKALLIKLFGADCHRYFRDLVWTQNEHDKTGHPFQRIPYQWRYIPELVEQLLTQNWLFVLKSRQILATWTALAYCLWVALFHEGKKIAIQSKKADDADALIQRIKVIYDRLPSWKPQADFSYCRIKIPTMGSDIYGIPQGPDQVRSFTYSIVLSDEFGFQDETEKTFAAVKPIVDGGGQFVAITTPPRNKNFSYACLANPLFHVHKIHYSARPDRGPAWAAQAKIGWSEEDWNRENELQFLQSGIKRVLADFNTNVHVSTSLIYNKELPLYRGWDFGYRRPCVGFVQIDRDDRVLILDCLLGKNVTIDLFADRVMAYTTTRFPDANIQDFCDIAGTQVSDKTEKTSVQILQSAPFNLLLRYRKFNIEDGLNLIRRKLSLDIGGKRAFQIQNTHGNQYLIDAMAFGYIYTDGGALKGDIEINEDGQFEREYYEHGIDVIRYILSNIYTMTGNRMNTATKLSAVQPLPQKRDLSHAWMGPV